MLAGNETSIKLKRMHTNRKSFLIKAHSASIVLFSIFISSFSLFFFSALCVPLIEVNAPDAGIKNRQ